MRLVQRLPFFEKLKTRFIGPLNGQLLSELGRIHVSLSNIERDQALARELLLPHYEFYKQNVSPGGAAASLEFASLLLAICRRMRPERVVDFGSGFSSFVLRLYARECLRVVDVLSVDDSSMWLSRTRDYLAREGLLFGELVDWNAYTNRPAFQFDLAVLDIRPISRRVDLLVELLRTGRLGSAVLVDDAHKDHLMRPVSNLIAKNNWIAVDLKPWTLDDYGRYALAIAGALVPQPVSFANRMAKTYYRVIRKLAFEKGPQSDAPKPYFNALLRSLPNPATRWLNNVSVTPVIGSRIWVQRAMRGTHEPALDLLLAASLRPGDLMVDVGAQKGLVTVMAAKLVGSAGRVIAIEPDQSNITIFREALKRNAATNVELRPVAASSHNGKGWYVREAYAGLISASNQNEEGIGSLIDTVRLDSMLMEAKALPRLVKVDVDGPEMDVVIGLGELLNRSDAPVLAVECSRYWERFGWTFGRAHRYLAERGYRIAVGHRTADRLSWIEDPASLPAGWGTLKGLAFNFFCFKPGSHDDVIAEWATKYQ